MSFQKWQIPQAPIGFRLCHELEGLLRGVRADGAILPAEFDRVRRWRLEVETHRHVAPFAELARHVDRALSDGHLTLEECQDLLFLTAKYTTVNPHFGALRAGVQQLLGVISGIAADRQLTDTELSALQAWLEEWEHAKGIWPYDECETIVLGALSSTLDRAAIDYLSALSAQFPIAGHIDVDTGEVPPLVVTGLCAVDPRIEFLERWFVFTGDSTRASRDQMEAEVAARGGFAHPRVLRRSTTWSSAMRAIRFGRSAATVGRSSKPTT